LPGKLEVAEELPYPQLVGGAKHLLVNPMGEHPRASGRSQMVRLKEATHLSSPKRYL